MGGDKDPASSERIEASVGDVVQHFVGHDVEINVGCGRMVTMVVAFQS